LQGHIELPTKKDEYIILAYDLVSIHSQDYKAIRRTQADGNGNFEIDDISPGDYTIVMKSSHAKDMTPRDTLGKIYSGYVHVSPAEVADESYDFGMTAF
jgi:hypothetical protein